MVLNIFNIGIIIIIIIIADTFNFDVFNVHMNNNNITIIKNMHSNNICTFIQYGQPTIDQKVRLT